jgi:hypothetical protein
MPESLAISNDFRSQAAGKPAMRILIMALAALALSASLLCAQTGPKPQAPTPVAAPALDDTKSTLDQDKKKVQDRWGTATGTPSEKKAKKAKPGNPETQKPAGATQ